MRLYITQPSPFARKCRIVAHEKGLAGRIEEIVADPYASDSALAAANPLIQVPALVTDDGTVFTDSPLICAWLDAHSDGPRLVPPESAGEAHWRVRRLETLADGALEMGVKLVLEKRRPESERSASWMARWTHNMGQALDALERWDLKPDPLDLGVITAAVAVTWISFRHPEYDWKTGRPKLVALQEALEARPSFQATRPG